MACTYTTGPKRRDARASGFSMLEVLIGGAVLAVALLGHTASVFSEHRMSVSERARSTALISMEQFMERMRSDPDFTGMFPKLLTLQEISARSPEAAQAWFQRVLDGYLAISTIPGGTTVDPAHEETVATCLAYAQFIATQGGTQTGTAALRDGRSAFLPQLYYPDFKVPSGIESFHVALEVPAAPLDSQVLAGAVLREDLPLSRFGLPADLNGDGLIDNQSHDADYRALPVIATFRWSTSSGAVEELRLSSWVWGYR